MSENQVVEHRHRGTRGITGAIILIGIGVAFLLTNLGVLTINWLYVLRFWPVLLVLIGLDLLLGRSALGSAVVAILGLAIVGGIFFFAATQAPERIGLSGNTITRDIEQELDGAEALQVTIELGAIAADIHAASDEVYAVRGEITTNEEFVVETTYSVSQGTGYLNITQQDTDVPFVVGTELVGELDLALTDAVPVDIIVTIGAGEVTLDLSGVNLRSLSVEGGAGAVTVILPDEGDFPVSLKAAVGNIDLTVPLDLEARVDFSGALTHLEVPDRFTEVRDDNWETAGYENARERATIEVDAALGAVTIR
jgi:hypothetical protein